MKAEALQRLVTHLAGSGDVMWPYSRMMYNRIACSERSCTALDVGCSIGAGSAILRHAGWDVTGIDVDFCALQIARNLYPGGRFRWWDISAHPWSDFPDGGMVDLVLSIESLEHMDDQELALKNMAAVARSTLIIATPNGARGHTPSEFHTHEFAPQELLELFTKLLPEWSLEDMRAVGTFVPVTADTTAGGLIYTLRRTIPCE